LTVKDQEARMGVLVTGRQPQSSQRKSGEKTSANTGVVYHPLLCGAIPSHFRMLEPT